MKLLDAEFLYGVDDQSKFPELNYPEIAFIGRSNVGKSSLINTLVLRKNLAYTSSKPGKTRQINFYLIDSKYIFADMPGFGFALRSKKDREHWQSLNLSYLTTRKNLILVVLLVDSRLEPQALDLAQIEIFEEYRRNYVLTLTKSDKISKETFEKRKSEFEFLLKNCNFLVDIIPFSSITKEGRTELLAIIKRQVELWKKQN
ncbi:MAG: ribosome biogenesis GTP-binding protein YihA/YsxC [Ignavibacteria bacterium]|nr:ribosome biogenesis GTP-binding protein YihA/YsxC [Ignavibacteria bacterium]